MPVSSRPVPDLPVPLDQPLHGLVLFTGHACVLSLSQLLCLQYLSRGEPVVLVDAANAFDALLISDAARARRWNLREMLDAVHLSRVYTCHQLEAQFTEHLLQAVAAFHPRAVLCLGLLDPLYDEDVSAAEAARIFRRLRTALLALSRRLPILAACPDLDASAGGALGRVIMPTAWARTSPGATVQGRPRGTADDLAPFEARRAFRAGLRRLARWSFTARPAHPTDSLRQRESLGAPALHESGGVLITREWPDPARWEWGGGLMVHPRGLTLRRR